MFSRFRLQSLRPILTPVVLLLCLLGLLALTRQPWNRGDQTVTSMPAANPPSGRYSGGVTVSLQPSNTRGQIIYTLDGSNPSPDQGSLYSKPLRLDTQGVITLRAVEVIEGEASPIRTATYVIDVTGELPILSIALPPSSLWNSDTGILANPTWRGAEWEREASMSYILPDGTESSALSMGLRVDKDGSKPDLRLYFRSEYGIARLSYPLFPQHLEQAPNTQSYKRLLLLGGHPGQDILSNATGGLWQDRLAIECASDMGLRTIQGHTVHLFINGQSWGLYYLTERVDRFFLEDNYGFTQVDAVREGRPIEGDDADWDALIDWVSTHDLAITEESAYVQSQIDVPGFIDAVLLILYLDLPPDSWVVMRPLLGHWEWLYAGGGETDPSSWNTSDMGMLYSALMADENFRLNFAARAADLLNTHLSPTRINDRIAALDSAWDADYHYEHGRWFYGSSWEEEISALQLWANGRSDDLYALIEDDTGLLANSEYTFEVIPPGTGILYTNGIPLDIGDETENRYFAGTVVTVTAQPERWPLPGFKFTGWEVCQEQTCQEITDITDLVLKVNTSKQVTANFAPRVAGECKIAANDVIISEYWINDNGTRYNSLLGRAIYGDWVELQVLQDNIDLRGWRLTDNDTLTGTAEGSIIFPDYPALSSLSKDTTILVITTENAENTATFSEDDLDARDKRLLFYVGNSNLNITADPGFGIGPRDDNIVLLAPGPTESFSDDVGIDFIAEGTRVTPYSFGILDDGVQFPIPFRFLGGDDGAIWAESSGDPDRVTSWRVDPPACQSGDAECWGERNQVTPGR